MSNQSSSDVSLSDLYKIFAENPWAQSWVLWQKFLWTSHPLSRLIPLDAEEIWRAFAQLGEDITARPAMLEDRTSELLRNYNELALWLLRRYMGHAEPELIESKRDRRFDDPAWTDNAAFSMLKQSYLILANWLLATTKQTEALDPQTQKRIHFYVRQFVEAISPSNFWLTNPAALRETLNTGGENLRRGMENLLEDIQRGEVRVAGKDHFTVGKNLALSPGQVVFRNELIELIQYSPKGDQVYRVPLLMIPPWINKFYVLDIRPGKSLIEYLVGQGYTIFLISWRNPDASLQDLTMEDYLRLGPLAAMPVVKAIAGSPKINFLGYCIGGTLLSILLAYLAAVHDETANTGTFFTALEDFSEVGETAIFISEEWLAEIEKRVHPKGYVSGSEMGSIFRLMRSNDLIWNFVVNNYLLGKEPLAFDLLYWSVDGTRMPRAAHSYYLRNMYLENNLVKPNKLRMLGQGIDLRCIRSPAYVVAGTEDHIVPWKSAHRAGAFFAGPTRLVLSYGGHIASVINPPSAGKGFYFTNESDTTDSDQWLETAKRQEGSWWCDWTEWLCAHSGDRVPVRALGNADYPPLAPAPGTYVVES